MAKLEQLLDEYATVQALDPAKLPALRARIWELVTTAQLHHDLHVEAAPGEAEFDDFVLHIDGYLCEVKDVQIRDGLHVLGAAPAGEAQLNLVLAVLRATQVWGGTARPPRPARRAGRVGRPRRAGPPGRPRRHRARRPSPTPAPAPHAVGRTALSRDVRPRVPFARARRVHGSALRGGGRGGPR